MTDFLFPNEPKRIKKNGETYIIRDTSVKAKREIEEVGTPGAVREQIMQIFNELQTPVTVGELFVIYTERYPNTGRSRNELAKRVSELKEGRTGGARIRECGKKRCLLTGRETYTYESIR